MSAATSRMFVASGSQTEVLETFNTRAAASESCAMRRVKSGPWEREGGETQRKRKPENETRGRSRGRRKQGNPSTRLAVHPEPKTDDLFGARPVQINLKDWFCFGLGLVLGQGQTDGTATQAPEGSTALWVGDDSLPTNIQDFPNWHTDGL